MQQHEICAKPPERQIKFPSYIITGLSVNALLSEALQSFFIDLDMRRAHPHNFAIAIICTQKGRFPKLLYSNGSHLKMIADPICNQPCHCSITTKLLTLYGTLNVVP